MSGVRAVRYLLANNAVLIATVPAVRIVAGPLPVGSTIPAVSVSGAGANEDIPVDMGANRMVSERVQVSVLAKTHLSQKDILALVRTALPASRGTVNGVEVDSVMLESEGPDFFDEAELLYMGSLDYMVRFVR